MSVAFEPADSDVACDSSYSFTMTIFVLARAAHSGCWRRTCVLCFRFFFVDDTVAFCWNVVSLSGVAKPVSVAVSAEYGLPASGSVMLCDDALPFSLLKYHSLMYR